MDHVVTLSSLTCNSRFFAVVVVSFWYQGFYSGVVSVLQPDSGAIFLFCSSCLQQQWWTDGGIKTHQTFTTSQTRPQRLTSEKSVRTHPPPHLSKHANTLNYTHARTCTRVRTQTHTKLLCIHCPNNCTKANCHNKNNAYYTFWKKKLKYGQKVLTLYCGDFADVSIQGYIAKV